MDGMLEATTRTMVDQGAKVENIRAAVGPCIGALIPAMLNPDFAAKALQTDSSITEHFVTQKVQNGETPPIEFWFQNYLVARLQKTGIGEITRVEADTYVDSRFYCHAHTPNTPSKLMPSVLAFV